MAKSKKKTTTKYVGPKVLLFDLETAPLKAWQWSLRQKFTPITMVDKDPFIITWSAKWLGEKKIIRAKLPDFKEHYSKYPASDKALLEPLWELMNEADMVVAHNAAGFDVPVANGRFLVNGFEPPNPYKIIDTLRIARREFRLISNKLDYLGHILGLGVKNKTDFDLWVGCMNNDKKCWNDMMKYNVQDVALLEKVYLKLRAWDKRHPNFGLFVDSTDPCCTVCASSNLIKKGYEYTQVGMYQRYKCKACGHPNRSRYTELPKEKRKTLLTNAV